MQFINLSIFLVIAAIVIAIVKPKSKKQVWLYSIIIPIVFSFVYGICVLLIIKSTLPISYRLGSYVGSNFPSVLVTIVVLFICLKKKFEASELYKFPVLILIPIIVCFVVGGVLLVVSHKPDKKIEQYFGQMDNEESMATENNSDIFEWDGSEDGFEELLFQEDDSDMGKTEIQIFHDEMVREAQSYDAELPEEIGSGVKMIKCAIENHSMVYTVVWEDMEPSDFSPENVAEFKDGIVEELIESSENPTMKKMLHGMRKHGYVFVYKFINGKGKKLCTIKIQPSEILD